MKPGRSLSREERDAAYFERVATPAWFSLLRASRRLILAHSQKEQQEAINDIAKWHDRLISLGVRYDGDIDQVPLPRTST